MIVVRVAVLSLFVAVALPSAYAQISTVTVFSGSHIEWVGPMGYCCARVALDEAPGPISAECQAGTISCPYYQHSALFSCNRPGTYTVNSCFQKSDSNQVICESHTVTITDPMAASCTEFQWQSPNLVLTRKFGSDDAYFSPLQSRDAQARLLLKVNRGMPGDPVYLRVTDPADPSQYRVAPSPDNKDQGAGLISLSPSGTGARTLSTTVPSTYKMDVYLNTSGWAAGDNYQVWASTDPGLLTTPMSNGPSSVTLSYPLTTWKRIYLEKKRMFRSGAFIIATAPPGATEITVRLPSGVTFAAGESIRLVHAPPLEATALRESHSYEDNKILAVTNITKTDKRLTLESPLAGYFGPDPGYSLEEALEMSLLDGVGKPSAGYFELNDAGLNNSTGPFGQAFVGFHYLTPQVKEVPYVPFFTGNEGPFSNRWFEFSPWGLASPDSRPGDPNVRHVLAGTGFEEEPNRRRLLTTHWGNTGVAGTAQIPSPNWSWTFVAAIEAYHGRNAVGATEHNRENVFHELAHALNVNPLAAGRHCSANDALQPALKCLMNDSRTIAERTDGKIGFHYTSDTDSEFTTLRWTTEPVPTP